jgi:hypothetical protein
MSDLAPKPLQHECVVEMVAVPPRIPYLGAVIDFFFNVVYPLVPIAVFIWYFK